MATIGWNLLDECEAAVHRAQEKHRFGAVGGERWQDSEFGRRIQRQTGVPDLYGAWLPAFGPHSRFAVGEIAAGLHDVRGRTGWIEHTGLPEIEVQCQLEYFTAITRLGGFRRAADELNVSQPALSQQIKLLEQELGVALFERGERQVTLTHAGRVRLLRAEHALAEVRMAREELREFATPVRGQVSVGVLSPSGMVWVPRLLAAFKRQFPRIEPHPGGAQ